MTTKPRTPGRTKERRLTASLKAHNALLHVAETVVQSTLAAGQDELPDRQYRNLVQGNIKKLKDAAKKCRGTTSEPDANMILAAYLARDPKQASAIRIFADVELKHAGTWQSIVAKLLRAVAISNGVGQGKSKFKARHKRALPVAQKALRECNRDFEVNEGAVETLHLFRMSFPLKAECIFAIAYHQYNCALPGDGDARIEKPWLKEARATLRKLKREHAASLVLMEDADRMLSTIDHLLRMRPERKTRSNVRSPVRPAAGR